MTPVCCWGERKLHESLKVIQGWPVSKSMVSIFLQISLAGTFLCCCISPLAANSSYSVYLFSNAKPVRSCRSEASPGEKSVHSASCSTLFINKSGTQLAVFMSCVLLRSSPVFFLNSKNSSISRCQVSR